MMVIEVYRQRLLLLSYLMKSQVVLNGVRGVEDGSTGSDDQDESIQSL